MKNIFVLFCFFILANIVSAKEPYTIIETQYSHKQSEVPSYIRYDIDDAPSVKALNSIFKNYINKAEGLGLKLIRQEKDHLGFTHQLYKQTFNNIPIEFSELRVHLKNGKIHSMNGSLIDGPPAQQEQILTAEAAINKGIAHIGADLYKWEIPAEEKHLRESDSEIDTYYPKAELTYVAPKAAIDKNVLRLAYKMNIYAAQPLSRTEMYVDAASGEIIFTNNLIHTGNSNGTAHTVYSGIQSITTDSLSPNLFKLRQTKSGGGVNTFNMKNGFIHANATDFTDSDNIWNNVNSRLDQYATDAHWGAEQTYDYFFTKHNRNSINNQGFVLNSYVHYSPNNRPYANAFWDGQRMTYGDGNPNRGINPLTAIDITGHEISHGLTNFTANLVYASESGALNESFSDIFGAAIEAYAKPNNANWKIGEDIGATLRSMSNPNAYNDPDTRKGNYWKTVVGCNPSKNNDNCGVHSNSGVQNYWFYLLTEGGSGTNDLNQSYNVQGLGIDTAAAIAFRNLTVYLGRTSNYDDARFYAIRSAIDLYGACSRPVKAVTNAWHAVGVGNPYINDVIADFNTLDVADCQPPFQVPFNDKSINAMSYNWSFGDGGTSTSRSPIHTYNSFGTFDVKLIVDGGSCGKDTLLKSNYISIDSSNSCIVKLQNGTNTTQNACTGILVDNGGSSGSYTPNQNSKITIRPLSAASVNLNFDFFDVESGSTASVCNHDYLEVFDGASENAPSLGKFCNNNLPPSTITSTRGVITIKFAADPGLEKEGFKINWSCNPPTQAPVADFSVDVDSTCNGMVQFKDLSYEGPNNWLWDFGDGNSSTQRDPQHQYAANGSYDVKLISTNSLGADTIVKTKVIVVDRPSAAIVQHDTVCINGNAKLQASGGGQIQWYTNEFGGNIILSDSILEINNLKNDTSFWVEDFYEAPDKKIGPSNNNVGSGNFYDGDQHLIFDVYQTITLKQVLVYGGSSGNRTIELRDQGGNVLQSLKRYIPRGPFILSLDFKISPGSDYQLGISGGSIAAKIPDLYRNNSGINYPYTEPGLMSIKNSSAGKSYYFFFYDWKVKALDCTSPRKKVSAIVDTSCTKASLAEYGAEKQLRLYPNPAQNEFYVNFDETKKLEHITLYNSQGAVVRDQKINVNNVVSGRYSINVSALAEGLYFVNFKLENANIRKRLIIIR